jgi:DNA-binding transcriptional MerR regulator
LRLQQILSLRSLGLSLAEIRAELDSGEPNYRKVVRAHLKPLEAEVHQLQTLHARLTRMDEILSREGELVTEDLHGRIEGISKLDKHVPPRYERLQKRHEELGDSPDTKLANNGLPW